MMPQMQDALNGWEEKITLLKLSSRIDDNGIQTIDKLPLNFMGTVQPLKPTQLEIDSSGQRKYEWWQIHTRFKLHLAIESKDRIQFKGNLYKVMFDKDYSRNGYLEYHLVQYING